MTKTETADRTFWGAVMMILFALALIAVLSGRSEAHSQLMWDCGQAAAAETRQLPAEERVAARQAAYLECIQAGR